MRSNAKRGASRALPLRFNPKRDLSIQRSGKCVYNTGHSFEQSRRDPTQRDSRSTNEQRRHPVDKRVGLERSTCPIEMLLF